MKNGTVKWFDSKRGYGFIIGDDGIDCFVHQSEILMKGFRYLEVGQKIRYQIEETERGNRAINVIVE